MYAVRKFYSKHMKEGVKPKQAITENILDNYSITKGENPTTEVR